VLLRRCLVSVVAGESTVDAAALSESVVSALADALGEADPLAAIVLALACPACGATTDVLLDPAALWWAEIERGARRTLVEVHRLASAYGWSETLSLGPVRRAAYLELVP